jgi:glycosyltransferase involved in cell wall biosynthesis
MRILHCISSMGGGGAERQLAYLAGELRTLGWDVHVALLSGGPNLERLRAGGAVIHRLTARSNYDPAILGQLLRLMRRLRPDLVETWITQMDILAGAAARFTGLPWILRERSGEPAYPRTLKHRWRVGMAAGASAVISNSAEGDRYWQSRLSGRVRRYVIRNALPFAEIESARAATREETGVEPGERLALYIGRLAPEKNLGVLVSALRLVLADPRIVAVLCGEGPLRSSVEKWLVKHGIADRVRLPGYVSNVWSWLKRADVFVSVSLFEGHPNAVMEAMACGCPVVVSDIPAHREFLDEESAVLVKADLPAPLTEAIANVLSAGEAATRRAAKARAKAVQWSIEAIGRRHADVYGEVLADHRGRSRRPR